jgi:hypothetical protein
MSHTLTSDRLGFITNLRSSISSIQVQIPYLVPTRNLPSLIVEDFLYTRIYVSIAWLSLQLPITFHARKIVEIGVWPGFAMHRSVGSSK